MLAGIFAPSGFSPHDLPPSFVSRNDGIITG
jgi:hypothetical protein